MTLLPSFIFFPPAFYLFAHKLGRLLCSTREGQPPECNATGTEVGCHLFHARMEHQTSWSKCGQLLAHSVCLWLGSDGAGWGPTQFLDNAKFTGSCLSTVSSQMCFSSAGFTEIRLIHELNPPKTPRSTMVHTMTAGRALAIVTLCSSQQLQTQAACHRKQPSSPHKVAYYALCLPGFTVTWSACDAER